MNDVIRERLKTVPNRPGCYLMRDRRGVIIYVGKAKNLRRRVLSYFRPSADLAPKVRSMVNSVADLEFMTVRNDAEALLTEASLIKKYKPHFNILMRDDKRYLALRADPDEPFPAFRTCRIVRDDGALYFGPFPSSPVVRAAKDFVEKRWGLRGCTALAPDGEGAVERVHGLLAEALLVVPLLEEVDDLRAERGGASRSVGRKDRAVPCAEGVAVHLHHGGDLGEKRVGGLLHRHAPLPFAAAGAFPSGASGVNRRVRASARSSDTSKKLF